MSEPKQLGTPIEGTTRPIPKEEWEKLGLDFSLSPQARKEIEELERLARTSWLRIRDMPVGADA